MKPNALTFCSRGSVLGSMDETCTSFLALFFRTNTRTSGTETPLEDSEPEQKYKQKQIKKCNLLKGLND